MFPSNWYHVFLQEIQDRIRIIELYAKDRQFADFVRQHQAWVAPLFSLLCRLRSTHRPNKSGYEEKGKWVGDTGVWQDCGEERISMLAGVDEEFKSCQSSVKTDLSILKLHQPGTWSWYSETEVRHSETQTFLRLPTVWQQQCVCVKQWWLFLSCIWL